ncbi:MAG: thiamine-phosphate kinase [Burkholderiaceae bacterium]|nr:thiamine-phosphate kinase [Burkholderiaceae bacterium]
MGEFELIRRYFQREHTVPNPAVALGIGDDCALLQPAPGMQLAISCDMLVEGRHFFADVDPEALGHKALAVNLSDLAASGARPLAFTLALSLPRADEAWLAAFARGLFALADAHGCTLMGGDTTRGPLNLCLTVFGEVPTGQALLRSGGRPGDELWVSGTLGDARLALEALQGRRTVAPELLPAARQRLERPTPRVALGLALRGIATAAMDLSDGLVGDLRHLLQASRCGARLDAATLAELPATRDAALDAPTRLGLVLGGGDDYELLFSASPAQRTAVLAAGSAAGVALTCIGQLEAESGLRVVDRQGQALATSRYTSFDHFA